MGRREANKADKLRRLTLAGLTRFREQGYDATSIAHIVSDADVARGTFYLYFPDRLALFDALLDRWFEPLDALLDEERQRLEQATTRAESRAIYEDIGGKAAMLALEHGQSLLLAFQESRSPSEAGDRVREREAHVLATIIALTDLAASRGLIDAPHPEVASRVVMGAVEKMLYDVLTTDWDVDPVAVAQETVRLLVTSLGAAVRREEET